MKWILVWIVSIATIFISAYHYNFYNSINELIKTYALVDFLIALFIGSISSSGSFLFVFVLNKVLFKFDIKVNNFFLTVLAFIFSISFCVIIIKRLYMILSSR